MCGVFGLINKSNQPVRHHEIEAGLEYLYHRGPDAKGVYLDRSLGLGNRRLSIIDPNAKSNQPLSYLHYHISYNGAIYNYLELKTELKAAGYSFHTQGDTEVILAAYDMWGGECVQRFNGMWAFIIYDNRAKKLFCSRDRFGIKPFYYWEDDNYFSIASEIKAFQSINSWKPFINHQRVYEYLVFGMQDQDEFCFFQQVKQLPAAHNLSFNLRTKKYEIRPYYSLPSKVEKIDFTEAKEKLREILFSAVNFRLRSDVSVGSCLSGGIDSSSIVASICAQNPDYSLSTLSAQFSDPDINEMKYVEALKDQWSFNNETITPDFEEMMSLIDQVIYHQDEPFSSFSVLAQYLVFGKAKELGLKVMLDGQGGDELFAGYDLFFRPYLISTIKTKPWLLPFYLINIYKNNELYARALFEGWQRLRAKETNTAVSWLDLPKESEKKITSNKANTIAEQSRILLRGMGLPVLLHYEDRNAMAHGVESRLPFLDYQMVELALALPDEYKIFKGRRKFILREAMKSFIPPSIYSRKDKKGFETPQNRWMSEHTSFFEEQFKTALKELPFISNKIPEDSSLTWRVILLHRWMNKFKLSC